MQIDWEELGYNIIKLEGYGVYVTCIDGKVYKSDIVPGTRHPTLDPDGCIDWEELTDPPNQQFLDIINERFKLNLEREQK